MGLPNTAEKPGAHAAHDGQVLELPAQARPLTHQLGQGAPHLQGSPLPAGRAPEGMGEHCGAEHHRGQQAGDRLLPPGGLDDQVGPPGGFDAASAVHPHHHQPRQGEKEAGPGRAVAQHVRPGQEPVKQAPQDPHQQPTPSPKSRPGR